MNWTAILSILAGLIVLAMAVYTVYVFRQLKQQQRLFAQARQQRMARIKESVNIIAQAMLNGECNHSEGVLRLKMLLEPLGQKRLNAYSAMAELYETVRDMPTHDARLALKKNERMQLDLQRESKEIELEEKIKADVKQLLDDLKNI
ncbi:DUF2489 domain-containing protein [Pasteurellaceae bacterium LIM206]|nr:DUF2489 domain-containing protein [Pasteurellaceae bacterium LIM206]